MWLSKSSAKGKIDSNTSLPQEIREKLNRPEVKWAVNGFAIGYITGNILEGLGVFDKSDNVPVPDPDDKTGLIDDTGVVEEEVDKIGEVLPPEPDIIDVPNPGDVLDLSSLEFGRVSSDANNLVDLLQEAGKAVEFDKVKILPDGTEMWHFKQLNGQGYAWFSKEEIMDLLKKQAESVAKISGHTRV